MRERRASPRHVVIIYFGAFALMWSAISAMLMSTRDSQAFDDVASGASTPILLLMALALHAAAVAIAAWKAPRLLFERGVVAVIFCGLPLLVLAHQLWFIPALLYAIAVAYAWMASRRESIGKLQASPRR